MECDLFTTGLLILIAVSLGVGVWSFLSENTELLKPTEKDLFSERVTTMTTFEIEGEGDNAIVSYAYTTGKLPEKLDPREVVSMRTESSYTKYMGDLTNPNAPEYKLEARVFSKPAFANLADGWYYVEYGKTTKKNFDEIMKKQRPLSWLFGEVAYAADTFFSAAGDGWVEITAQSTWSAARDATTGSVADPTSVFMQVASGNGYLKADAFYVYRAFVPFDTSAISSSASISSATISVYATSSSPTDTMGTSIGIYRSSQATHTTLATTDFDNVATTLGSDTISVASVTFDAYNTFTLNSTGLTWIAKSGVASNCSASTGISCFVLRTTHDANNTSPTSGVNNGAFAYFGTSEASDTVNDPYLTVNYVQTFAPWQFWEF